MQFVIKYYREVSSLSRFAFQNTAGVQILTLHIKCQFSAPGMTSRNDPEWWHRDHMPALHNQEHFEDVRNKERESRGERKSTWSPSERKKTKHRNCEVETLWLAQPPPPSTRPRGWSGAPTQGRGHGSASELRIHLTQVIWKARGRRRSGRLHVYGAHASSPPESMMTALWFGALHVGKSVYGYGLLDVRNFKEEN